MSEQILNPVTPVVGSAVVASGNPMPVWVVSGGGGGSSSNGFPITSGTTGTVQNGGVLEVASGGIVQIDSGGREQILAGGVLVASSGGLISVTAGGSMGLAGSTSIQSGATLGIANAATLVVSSGATLGTNSGSTLGLNAGTLIPASAANTLNAALTNDPNTMPYQTGNWYFGAAGVADSAGGAVHTANSMLAYPFFVSQPGTVFTSMGVFAVSNTPTYSVMMGIYRANSNGSTTVPTGATLVSGTGASAVVVTSNTSGLMAVDISTASLSVGWHFLAMLPSGTVSAYRLAVGNTSASIGLQKGQSTFGSAISLSNTFFHSQAFGTLPATFPISALGQNGASVMAALGVKAA